MIKHVKIDGVGPLGYDLEVGQRLNLFAGDNGLGKSFLLDVVWGISSVSRMENIVLPLNGNPRMASINVKFSNETEQGASYADAEGWKYSSKPSAHSARHQIVLYAEAGGSFKIWDSARCREKVRSYVFSASDVFEGLEHEGKPVCNGLLNDWAFWQNEKSPTYKRLVSFLETLSPDEYQLSPGALQRLPGDSIRYPSIRMPYGEDVPITKTASSIQQVAKLVYLLVWAWEEFQANRVAGGEAVQFLIILDEPEVHLHPRWQRTLLPSVLEIGKSLTEEANVNMQYLISTHSPFVISSAETLFKTTTDRAWQYDLKGGKEVELTSFGFTRRGAAEHWLQSELFDLKSTYPKKAEEAVMMARKLLLKQELVQDLEKLTQADDELRKTLSDIDPFWVRWSAWFDRQKEMLAEK